MTIGHKLILDQILSGGSAMSYAPRLSTLPAILMFTLLFSPLAPPSHAAGIKDSESATHGHEAALYQRVGG